MPRSKGATAKSASAANGIRMVVYPQGDGSLIVAVLTRSWTGKETLDRRLVPSAPLEAPPACPPGLLPHVWVLAWAACKLLGGYRYELYAALSDSGVPGGTTGANPRVAPEDRLD